MKRLHNIDIKIIISVIIIVILCSGIWYVHTKNKSLSTILSSQKEILSSITLENDLHIKDLQTTISDLTTEKNILTEALTNEQNKNNDFEKQINRIAGKVDILEKLKKTDPELLQKYSKVYFLNEHYSPSKLSIINASSTFDKNKTYEIHSDVLPHLESLLKEAQEDNVFIEIVSAYRSFGEQEALKSSYKVMYGSGANKFSADQGYSEHQLGTTIDVTTPVLGANFEKFESTAEYKWLTENAYRFGFILSYPKGNTYYQFEPWHWRFVGVDLARKLHRDEATFYGTDQRTIDEYLVDLFD